MAGRGGDSGDICATEAWSKDTPLVLSGRDDSGDCHVLYT